MNPHAVYVYRWKNNAKRATLYGRPSKRMEREEAKQRPKDTRDRKDS